MNLLDQGISPLLYNGSGGSVQLAYLKENQKIYAQIYARFDLNLLQSAISGAEMISYHTELSYQHYFKRFSLSSRKTKLYPGISGFVNWGIRNHTSYTNNSYHIDTRISIAPSVAAKRDFNLWGRDFTLGSQLHLPLISYVGRPLYASTKFPSLVANDDPKWYDYISEGKLYSLGGSFTIKTQTFLKFQFNNGNAVKLDYFWSYSSLQDVNPIKTGEHALLISTILKL